HLTVADAVGEVDDQANEKPAEDDLLGEPGQGEDEIERSNDSEDRHEGNEGRAEWPLHLRSAAAEDPDAGADNRESEQRAHVGELAEPAYRKQRGQDGGDKSHRDIREPGGAEFRVDVAGPLPQKTVAGHGEEDARLTKEHDQHCGAESADGAEFDQQGAPAMAGDIDAGGDWR